MLQHITFPCAVVTEMVVSYYGFDRQLWNGSSWTQRKVTEKVLYSKPSCRSDELMMPIMVWMIASEVIFGWFGFKPFERGINCFTMPIAKKADDSGFNQFSSVSVMMITITSEVKLYHVQSIKVQWGHCFAISANYYLCLCTQLLIWNLSVDRPWALSHVGEFDLDFQMSKLRYLCLCEIFVSVSVCNICVCALALACTG